MRHVLMAAILVAAVFPVGTDAQAKPDFSGTWTRVAEKGDSTPQRASHTITQTATEIAVTMAGRNGPETSVYTLDGRESINQSQSPEGPLAVKGTARWEGNSLVIETTRVIQGMSITTREIRTLDPSGKMTIEAITRSPQGEVTRTVVLVKS